MPPASPLAAELAREASAAHDAAADWFHAELDSIVTIVWVADRPTAPVAGLAEPSRARITLFAPALAPRPDRLRSVLVHEMCHLLLASRTSRAELAPPRWLDEGLAMWISGTWDLGLDWRADDSSLLADAAAAGSLLPLEELESSFPQGPFFHVAYAESHSFVAWLVDRGGDESLRRLLRRLASDVDLGPAFESTYAVPLEEAEREWRRTLHPSGLFSRIPSAQALAAFGSVAAGILIALRFVQVRRRLARAEPHPPAESPSPADPLPENPVPQDLTRG